jgi:hypothetical protein
MPDDPSGELVSMDLAALLISYNTWRGRLIPAQPRRCNISSQLTGSQKAAPIPRCPFIDPHWDEATIESALTHAVSGPLASRAVGALSQTSPPVEADGLSVWADE